MKTLNMLGNPCPIPVIEAKKALASTETDGVIVLVDNIVAVQNLRKMGDGLGYQVTSKEEGENYEVIIIKDDTLAIPEEENVKEKLCIEGNEAAVVLITSNQMGKGSQELGGILMKGFIFSLTELPILPKAVIFLNSGVKLSTKGSNTLGDLAKLEENGCEILSCGTCLNYYNLTEDLAVGKITDMFDIASRISSTVKLISL